MPIVTIDGIKTNYEVIGEGPPLLMYSPGGFDASMNKWSDLGVYSRIQLPKNLSEKFTCITFDRRETGLSGGRVERVTWDHYVSQGKGLLDHLGYEKSNIIGGCMGVCPVTRFSVNFPDMIIGQVLFWPVGGVRFRIRGHDRFNIHLAFIEERGLSGVVELAKSTESGFGKDPRIGPWGPVIRMDTEFASRYAKMDVEKYKLTVKAMSRTLLDRDTAPGSEPEDLMQLDIPTLIIPGRDIAHATSSARYLEECIPDSQYWDITPDDLTEDNVNSQILSFLEEVN